MLANAGETKRPGVREPRDYPDMCQYGIRDTPVSVSLDVIMPAVVADQAWRGEWERARNRKSGLVPSSKAFLEEGFKHKPGKETTVSTANTIR